jgi:L-threonylcarbamoyladenylate synthase
MHKDRPASDLIRDADDAAIAEAARILRAGGLVAFPTETVYGLGADATDDEAVASIFAAKARPQFNPLIVHVPDAATAAREAVFDARAEALAAEFWPGPLSLVLPRAASCRVSLLCSAGLPSLALRAPSHPIAQKLLRATGRPIAAPSANRSGKISPTTANHVADGLGNRIAMILDGGACQIGLESTVLDLSGENPVLLRPGSVTREEMERVIGPVSMPSSTTPLVSPGMLASHYAPRLPLRMNAHDCRRGEALLAFGPVPRGMEPEENLSPSGDLTEAAAHLFAALHRLDRPDFTGIAVMPIPESGLGIAINDRLRRAAAPRP